MYYMGFTYAEGMALPIWQRTWFLQRIQKEMETAGGKSRAAHSNDSTSRAMAGMQRQNTPAKLRRFT